MDRAAAWELLCEYVKNENLRRHALAVEACVKAYAKKFGEDEETWSVVALLHDFDYEIHPNAPDHPVKGSEILKAKGLPEDLRRAILGHADYTGVPRDTRLAKALFASDAQQSSTAVNAWSSGPLVAVVTELATCLRQRCGWWPNVLPKPRLPLRRCSTCFWDKR